MLIAHLPAGYLTTKCLQKCTKTRNHLWIGLVASVIPDLDLLYFYLIDNRQTNHHDYLTHLPVFWGVLLFYSVAIVHLFIKNKKPAYVILLIFYGNIFIHMALDSFAGYISWFYPFFYMKANVVEVPATYDWWVWSFVLHWSFIVELIIFGAAFYVFRKRGIRKCND